MEGGGGQWLLGLFLYKFELKVVLCFVFPLNLKCLDKMIGHFENPFAQVIISIEELCPT
jgi:hypothetical protein